jgi:hypothetical protein
MEACWKPGKSHRKLIRKTAESRTLGVSMASEWLRLPRGGDGTPGRKEHGAAGQRPGPGSSGGLRVRGAGSQPHKPRPCHAPSRPSPGGEERGGREGRAEEEGRVGGEAVWCGQEEWGRGAEGCRCAARRSAPAGRVRGCGALSSALAGGGRASLSCGWAGSTWPCPRSCPSAAPCGSQSSPDACTFLGAGGRDQGGDSGAPQRRLGAGASVAGCARAPGGGTFSPPPEPQADRWLPSGPAQNRGSLAAGQTQGPVLHSPVLSVGYRAPQRPASIPNLRGQGKATSL